MTSRGAPGSSAPCCGPRGSAREEAENREKCLEVLALFGERLLPRLGQPASALSYANRRRAEIARALVSAPG